MYAYVFVCKFTWAGVCMYLMCVYIYVHVNVYVYVCVHVYVYICIIFVIHEELQNKIYLSIYHNLEICSAMF